MADDCDGGGQSGRRTETHKACGDNKQGLPLIDYFEVTGPGVDASLLDKKTAEQW